MFFEETILSIMQQDYPNLEYIIIDGGSSDNSVDITEKYKDQLTYWVSDPDKGMSDHKMKASWLEASIEYLKEFKAGGIIE